MFLNITDTHCDTLCKLLDENLSFDENDLHIALSKLNCNHNYTQLFACFVSEKYRECAKERCVSLTDTFHNKVLSDKVKLCTGYNDIINARKENKMSAFLAIEGGYGIEEVSDVEFYYNRGVRFIGIVWNDDNMLASGVLGNGSVTDFGRMVISKMNELGIFLDVSHMNDRSFCDAIELTELPPFATHSNSRAVCNNPRNLSDEQFKLIKEKGGFVGINYYPLFVTGSKKARITDIIKHMEHFLGLGGEDVIGLGSDFDGIDFVTDDLSSIGDIDKLIDEMKRIGWSDCLVRKILSENFENIVKKIEIY